jgi:hypothetical protein
MRNILNKGDRLGRPHPPPRLGGNNLPVNPSPSGRLRDSPSTARHFTTGVQLMHQLWNSTPKWHGRLYASLCVRCTHRCTWPPSAFLQHSAISSPGQVTFAFHRTRRIVTFSVKGCHGKKSNSSHILRPYFAKIHYCIYGSCDSPLLMRSCDRLISWGPATRLFSWGPATRLFSWGPATRLFSWGPATHLFSWGLRAKLLQYSSRSYGRFLTRHSRLTIQSCFVSS